MNDHMGARSFAAWCRLEPRPGAAVSRAPGDRLRRHQLLEAAAVTAEQLGMGKSWGPKSAGEADGRRVGVVFNGGGSAVITTRRVLGCIGKKSTKFIQQGHDAIGDIHGHLCALEDLLAKVLPLWRGRCPRFSRLTISIKVSRSRVRGSHHQGERRSAVPVVALLAITSSTCCEPGKIQPSFVDLDRRFRNNRELLGRAAASIQAEFEAAGPRNSHETVRVGYEVFFDAVPATHLAFFSGLKTCHETDDVICVQPVLILGEDRCICRILRPSSGERRVFR